MIINSYAKVNLYLKVIRKRKDHYHSIKTCFERISLCDKIVLTCLPEKKIEIISDSKDIPLDHTNLAYKASVRLQKAYRIQKGVRIRIIKRIPVGAGLGGGSSNAAAVLMALNTLWKLRLSGRAILKHANAIGSDVAFFTYNTAFALGTGRGEKISPLKRFQKVKLWHILVVPRLKVSTPLIYKKWDTFEKLTKPGLDGKLLYSALRENDLSLLRQAICNSLEPVTISLYPEVNRIKEKLLQLNIPAVSMSGSGPAVFGVVSSRKEAVKASAQLTQEDATWQIFTTCTV